MKFTLSVNSFQVPATLSLPPVRRASFRTHLAGHAGHFRRERIQGWSTIVLMVF